jgi:hypothetical protein
MHEVVPATDGERLVHVVTDDETAAACPACGVISTSVRQHRTNSPRDLAYGEQPLAVLWHTVWFTCRESVGNRSAFIERIDELPAEARVMTGRLLSSAAARPDHRGCRALPTSTAGPDRSG